MTVSKPLFVKYSIAEFHVNFSLSIIVFCTFLSNTFNMANPEISSMNGTSTCISFWSFGFNIIHFFGKIGIDLFKKIKQDSQEFIMPSN